VKILAVDTATEACSAALLIDDAVASREALVMRGHAEHVLPMVDELLAEAGISLRALDAIAFGRGPGAFTGVRIAVSIAQGLAFGAELPAVPVSDLAALGARALERAAGEWPGAALEALVALDARMAAVYCARVRPHAALGVELLDEALAAPEGAFASALEPGRVRVAAGHGFSAYPELASRLAPAVSATWTDLLPRAVEIARLGARGFAAGLAVSAEAAVPVYLRDDVAQQSGAKRPR